MHEAELNVVGREWIATARAAWPDIALDEGVFVAQLAARLPDGADAATARALHAADLWLTTACAAGDPAALAAFDRAYLAPLDAVLVPKGFSPDQIDEVKQELRRKLLVGDGEGGAPRIAEYSGRADLRTWIWTTAVRAGIDLLRRQRDTPCEDEALAELPAIADDPELAHLKDRYRDELRAAVAEAMGLLAPRERLLLRYHYLDGASIDRIGALLGVHRATAARWVNAAREALADRTHRLLIARLGVSPSELRSIARLVESQLDLSIRRLLD